MNLGENRNRTFTFKPEKHFQTVKTFGVSGAWWSTGVGDRNAMDEMLKLLFTDKGIGLNNYRHNIGGGVFGGPLSDDKSTPDRWRAVPCPLKEDGSIVPDADKNGWEILKKVNALGTVNDITMFVNSPPDFMTRNGKTFGTEGRSDSNLRPECTDNYVKMLADVITVAEKEGINVKYISPFNEPQWQWEKGWQEGCFYSVDQMLDITRRLIIKFAESGIKTKVSINESANMFDENYVYEFYKKVMSDDSIYPYVDHLCAHSYFTDFENKKRLYQFMNEISQSLGKNMLPIYQTEWAAWHITEKLDPVKRMMMTARDLYECLTALNVEVWEYFSAIGLGEDSLIVIDESRVNEYRATRHFWVLGNYSRFLKNSIRIDLDKGNLPDYVYGSAYVKDNDIIAVLVNEGDENTEIYFMGISTGVSGIVYETSENCICRDVKCTINPENGYVLPCKSVSTIIFKGGVIECQK